MKKYLLLLSVLLLVVSCKKKVDDMDFSGLVIDARECTGTGVSISDMDFGWVVALDTPTGVGVDYTNTEGKRYSNVVILYGTKSRLSGRVSGRLYMDSKYASSYCNIRYNDLPQAVCSRLD